MMPRPRELQALPLKVEERSLVGMICIVPRRDASRSRATPATISMRAETQDGLESVDPDASASSLEEMARAVPWAALLQIAPHAPKAATASVPFAIETMRASATFGSDLV